MLAHAHTHTHTHMCVYACILEHTHAPPEMDAGVGQQALEVGCVSRVARHEQHGGHAAALHLVDGAVHKAPLELRGAATPRAGRLGIDIRHWHQAASVFRMRAARPAG
jgi:hypothetical protein